MKDKNTKPIDTVKYSHFKKCLTSLERDFKGRPEVLDNIDISFEYVIGSLFPNILSNIENTFAQNYIQGYNKGLSENFKSEKLEDISESKELIKEAIKYIKLADNNINNAIRVSNTNDKEILSEISTLIHFIELMCSNDIGEEI